MFRCKEVSFDPQNISAKRSLASNKRVSPIVGVAIGKSTQAVTTVTGKFRV